MLNPFLTLMVAGALHGPADEAFRPADFSALVIELAETVSLSPEEVVSAEPALTVRDVPFYYDDFSFTAVPDAPAIVTYDWRSSVIFDVP